MCNPKKKLTLLIVLTLLSSPLFAAVDSWGIAAGIGDPNNKKGTRLNYRKSLLTSQCSEIHFDTSYAYWQSNISPGKHLHVFAVAPVLKILLHKNTNYQVYFEASVGPAFKSTRYVNLTQSGSHLTFQDILGFEMRFKKHYGIRLHYLHYSNAGLAPPNPGIDIAPLLTFAYYF